MSCSSEEEPNLSITTRDQPIDRKIEKQKIERRWPYGWLFVKSGVSLPAMSGGKSVDDFLPVEKERLLTDLIGYSVLVIGIDEQWH